LKKERRLNLSKVQIETNNLILKSIEEEYAQSIFDEFTDEITLYMFPKPAENIDGVKQFIVSSKKGLQDGSNLQLVILEKPALEFIGCAGLLNIGEKDPELGLWIKKSAQGNSYGLEAITEIIKWARGNMEFEYLRYPVDKRNFASRRIPERNGGIIKREYKKINQKGYELDEVEYWIYK
jgi:ribosomal-protein-alanine N-acetyltransferase